MNVYSDITIRAFGRHVTISRGQNRNYYYLQVKIWTETNGTFNRILWNIISCPEERTQLLEVWNQVLNIYLYVRLMNARRQHSHSLYLTLSGGSAVNLASSPSTSLNTTLTICFDFLQFQVAVLQGVCPPSCLLHKWPARVTSRISLSVQCYVTFSNQKFLLVLNCRFSSSLLCSTIFLSM
jgi:hypothetical protein